MLLLRGSALVASLCFAVAACSTPDESLIVLGSSTTLGQATTSSSVGSITTLRQPQDAHVFEGEWLLVYTLINSSEEFSSALDIGDRDVRTATVSLTCPAGPCNAQMAFRNPYLQEDLSTFQAVWNEGAYQIRVEELGVGRCTVDDVAYEDGLDLTTSVNLVPTEFESSEAAWRVTALTGSRLQEWTPNSEAAAAGCESFSEEFSVVGRPLDPEEFSMPASDPLEYGSIVLRQTSAEHSGLSVVEADGTVRHLGVASTQFALSPDGGTVAYVDGQGLWVSTVDGTGAREFFPDHRVSHFSDLSWSPDGRKLAFVRDNTHGGADVWYVEVPYGVPTRLTEGGDALGGVTWDVEGTGVLFDWGVNETDPTTSPETTLFASTIYRYDVATRDFAEVVNGGVRPNINVAGLLSYLVPGLDSLGRPFRWSIRVADPDGSRSREVVTASLAGGCASIESAHAAGIPCSVPVSPDGDQVVFSNGSGCPTNDCIPGAFQMPGVWVWNMRTGERASVIDKGVNPHWVTRSGGSSG